MINLIFAALLTSVSHAELLTLTPGGRQIEGVNVSAGGSVNLDGRNYSLSTAGAGLRRSKVFGPVAVRVYVGQILVADPGRFVKTPDGALPSIDHQLSLVMHLTFLRDIPSRRIVESFLDSLAANSISDKDADVEKFVRMVQGAGDMTDKSSITMFVTKNSNGTETLAFDVKSDKNYFDRQVVAAGFSRKMASLWLGVPADDGLANFKTELLQ